ncbi:MAG: ATP-binding protein, partial [Desulfobacterium sp.]|nr:ATP-binding protein [Desulfobacterium sp.]MBU4035855.1 ATP-binding protein [Pseudomonadota bacterium]
LTGNAACETPLLLVYEEAHKYVPKSDLVKYRASKTAIERIAKEGRKYGITLGIVSQRPAEISETIFSQCNNFIAMRLTNPDDQNYVKRLLPDSLGNLTDTLPALKTGEALLIGDSIVMPSIVKVDECKEYCPSSNDINYVEIWKEKWKDVVFNKIVEEWKK